MKRCRICDKQKPLRDFYRDKHSRDGYSGVCKTCTYERVRAWQRAHPARVREQQRRYYLKHYQPKERKPPTEAELQARQERRAKWQRDYYHAHRDEVRAMKRAYRKKHRQQIRAYFRKYYAEHREAFLKRKAEYRKRQRELIAKRRRANRSRGG